MTIMIRIVVCPNHDTDCCGAKKKRTKFIRQFAFNRKMYIFTTCLSSILQSQYNNTINLAQVSKLLNGENPA